MAGKGIGVFPGTKLLTIGDSTPDGKSFGSIAEVQVKRIIENTAYYESSIRATAIAEQIAQLAGVGTAVYRRIHRNNWSAKYDIDAGAKRKRTSSDKTTLQIDKIFNFKLMIEEYDTERFLAASPDVRGQMIGGWIDSLTKSLLGCLELTLRQGMITWALAHYNKNDKTPTILVVDKDKFTGGSLDENKANVIAFEQKVLAHMTRKLKEINATQVGTTKNDWELVFSMELYNAMVPAFTQFIDQTGAKALTSGLWYENSVMGYPIQQDIFLEQSFPKGTSGFNDDVSWDTSGVCGLIFHRGDWAMPGAFKSIRTMVEQETGNFQMIGKYLGTLPMSLRGMTTIIMDHEPTEDEIKKAKALCAPQNKGLGDIDDWETFRCQLAEWDVIDGSDDDKKIDSVLTVKELGELVDNKEATITAAVMAKNPKLEGVTLKVSKITDTSAEVEANGYTGEATVSFTIKKEPTPTKYDIAVDNEAVSIKVGETGTFTITNFEKLTNVKIVSGTPATATFSNKKGVVSVVGVAEGTSDITISADNANANKVVKTTVAKKS